MYHVSVGLIPHDLSHFEITLHSPCVFTPLHFSPSFIEQYLLEDVALVPERLSKISLQVILFPHRALLYLSPNSAEGYDICFLLTIFIITL